MKSKKDVYTVWTEFTGESNISRRFVIINLLTKKIHSSWSDLEEARKAMKDLNTMYYSQSSVS